MLFNADTVEQIKKLTYVKDLKDGNELIFRLGQIRGICDQILAEHAYIENDKKATTEVLVDVASMHPFNGLVSDTKTFAEKCKEIIPEEKPCTDDDTKVIQLLERRGEHMNLKFEINRRWVNSKYAKMVYDLLSKHGICTMADLMSFLDDPYIRDLVYYRESRKRDETKKLVDRFPIFDLSGEDCRKVVNIYDTANDKLVKDGKSKNAETVLTEFLNMPSVRHRNAVIRSGITNVNALYFWLSHHTLKDYKNIRGLAEIPDSVHWLYIYIHKEEKK